MGDSINKTAAMPTDVPVIFIDERKRYCGRDEDASVGHCKPIPRQPVVHAAENPVHQEPAPKQTAVDLRSLLQTDGQEKSAAQMFGSVTQILQRNAATGAPNQIDDGDIDTLRLSAERKNGPQ